MKTALLLGGQGATMSTLGVDLYEQVPEYRAVIDQASAVLGYDLFAEVMTDGDKLKLTSFAQPAIFAHEMGIYAFVQSKLSDPVGILGLSLGEYTALTIVAYLSLMMPYVYCKSVDNTCKQLVNVKRLK